MERLDSLSGDTSNQLLSEGRINIGEIRSCKQRENINTLLAGKMLIFTSIDRGESKRQRQWKPLQFENSGYRTGYYPLWNWLKIEIIS
jgi:hypothetical protein